MASVLQETKKWFEAHQEHFQFVDPEIGHFAGGVLKGGSQFAFLHFVSDNLARRYPHDLSNERQEVVRAKREECYARIRKLLISDIVKNGTP